MVYASGVGDEPQSVLTRLRGPEMKGASKLLSGENYRDPTWTTQSTLKEYNLSHIEFMRVLDTERLR